MNILQTSFPRVVIIGGGFAGLAAAKGLEKQELQVVLIDKHNYHTFQPLLYQVATGGLEPDSIAFPLRKRFNDVDNFYFRLADVTNINPDKNTIETSIGNLDYDELIIATGSTTNFFGNTNIQKHTMEMKSIPQSLNIRSLILENFEDLEAVGEEHRQDILDTTKEEVFDLLKEELRPEFLNRIDETILFTPLTQTEINEIVEIPISDLYFSRFDGQNILFSVVKGITIATHRANSTSRVLWSTLNSPKIHDGLIKLPWVFWSKQTIGLFLKDFQAFRIRNVIFYSKDSA